MSDTGEPKVYRSGRGVPIPWDSLGVNADEELVKTAMESAKSEDDDATADLEVAVGLGVPIPWADIGLADTAEIEGLERKLALELQRNSECDSDT